MPPDPATTPTPDDQQALIAFLAQRDATCPACRYNLRGLANPVCPECGNTLKLAVGLVDGVSRRWIASLVLALIPAGVGLPMTVVLLLGFTQGLQLRDLIEEPEGIVFLFSLIYLNVCLVGSIALIKIRRRFQTWPPDRQNAVFASLILGNLIVLIMLLWLLSQAF